MLSYLPFLFWSILVTGLSVGLWLLFRGYVTSVGGKVIAKRVSPRILRYSKKMFWISVLLILFNVVYVYFRYFFEGSDLIATIW